MASSDPAPLRVATSGWQYDHWRGPVYPPELPKRRWFEAYRERFDCLEVNGTFYGLPKLASVRAWREESGADFRFCCKYSRFGSHRKRLKDPEQHLQAFVDVVAELRPRLGPVLLQLPPRWKPRIDRLDALLDAAPDWLRWAVEIRDPRWFGDELDDCLQRHAAALVIHDMLEDHPRTVTTDFTYCRFHGDHYRGRYGADRLRPWAEWMQEQRVAEVGVWAFFNNDENGYAVADAEELRGQVLGLE